MAENEEVFVTRIVTEADNALSQLAELRARIDEYKDSIKVAANQTKEDFSVIAESIRRANEAIMQSLPSDMSPEALSQAMQSFATDQAALAQAVRELNQEQAAARRENIQAIQQQSKAERDAANFYKQQEKDKAAATRQSVKEREAAIQQVIALQREEERAVAQSYGNASAAAQAYRQKIEEIKIALQQMSQQQGITLKDAAEGMIRSGQASASETGQALRELGVEAEAAGGSFSKLGEISQLVFGTILGVSAVTVLRDLIRWFSEAGAAAIEFSKSQFQLEVAVRGLQRSGLDTTLQNWRDTINEIKQQFPIFSRADITEAISQAGLMTREFGFTEEQIQNTVKAGIVLAEVTGTTLTDAIRRITVAIGSGYTEALQRAGLNISKGTLQQSALNAGYTEAWNSLDPLIRAQITYEAVLEGVADIQADAGKIVETWAGQLQAANARLEDQKVIIGQSIAPLQVFLANMKAFGAEVYNAISPITVLGRGIQILVRSVEHAVNIFKILFPEAAATVEGFVNQINDFFNTIINIVTTAVQIVENVLQTIEDRGGRIGAIVGEIRSYLSDLRSIMTGQSFDDLLGDTEIGLADTLQDEVSEVTSITNMMMDEINAAVIDGNIQRKQIHEDYARAILEIWIKHYAALADLERSYFQGLADLNTKYLQDVADENTKYANAVADANARANEQKAAAERKYRSREISEEAKFQEKLRQLREDFLLDLEDAVRERDARQIIRLIRNYNKEREQLVRENDLRRAERRRQFQDELADIEAQRKARLRQLAVEHQRRLQQLALQYAREKEQKDLEYQRDKEELEEQLQRQLEARARKYGEQLTDLEQAIENRLAKIFAGYAEEYAITAEQAAQIYELLASYYGPGGYIDGIYQYYLDLLNQVAQTQAAVNSATNPKSVSKPPGGFYGQAEGGTIIANRPTTVTFGEAGIEAATFTPLNRAGVNVGKVAGSLPAGLGGGWGNALRLELLLSPDLQARIIDTALNEMAEVVLSVERARR